VSETSEEQAAATTAQNQQQAGQEAAPRAERARRRSGGRFGRRRVCAFCADKTAVIDYKEPARLRRYVSDRGKIEPRRKTGTCAKHQRELTIALKRARHLALLPFTAEHIRISGVQLRG
jgi:small subunit ribosomal protein S18